MRVDPYLDRIEYRVYVIEKEPLISKDQSQFSVERSTGPTPTIGFTRELTQQFDRRNIGV